MGIIRKSIVATALTAAGTIGYLSQTTSVIRPLVSKDPVFSSKPYKKYNKHNNPSTQDVCFKRVAIDKIRPELLQNEGDLVVELTRGVFSGIGYEVQRRYLERKYRSDATATDLWTREDLATSKYEPGTLVNDHFEVVEKTPTTITVRCGDSPRKQDPRDSDGIFSFIAVVDRERGEVELGLKSVFFTSSRKVEGEQGPMGPWIDTLHVWYSRMWLATGSRRLMR